MSLDLRKLVIENINQTIEVDVSKYSKKKMWWITILLMAGSGVFGIVAYTGNNVFIFVVAWMMAFFAGQFYFIYEYYDDLKSIKP